MRLFLLLAGLLSVAADVRAQCPVPLRPSGLTWAASGSALDLWWVPSTAGAAATRWTLVLTTAGGSQSVEVDGPRSLTRIHAVPGVYDVVVIGANNCGAGPASFSARIDTTTPPPATGIVINELGPFIELRNTGGSTVNVGGWRVYGSLAPDQRIVEGPRVDDLTFLRPGCTLLLGDDALEGGVPRDFAMPRAFGDSASLALARADGRLIDRVGRAPDDEGGAGPPFVEGVPLLPAAVVPLSDTRSYTRSGADTEDNRRDFVLASPPTPQNLESCAGVPAPPFGVAATVHGASVTLAWTWTGGGVAIDGFQLEAGTLPGRSDVAVARVASATRMLTVESVPPGVYYVRIRAFAGALQSAASNEVTLSVCASGPCGEVPGAPTALRWVHETPDVRLEWTAPATGGTPTSYVIEAGSRAGASDLAVFDTNRADTSLLVRNVPPGTYWVRVRARNATGVGPPSNELIVVHEVHGGSLTEFPHGVPNTGFTGFSHGVPARGFPTQGSRGSQHTGARVRGRSSRSRFSAREFARSEGTCGVSPSEPT